MKIHIEKIKPKCPIKRVSFYLRVDQIETISRLDYLLENRSDVAGRLPWCEHLAEKINAEIRARSNAKDRNCIEKKFALSADLVERMSQSDTEYRSKGYVPEWNDHVSRILDQLIRTYSRQLISIFGDALPPEIDEYLNKSREKRRALNSNSGSERAAENG